MSIISDYFAAKQAILDHVGLVLDHTQYVIADETERYWCLTDREVVSSEYETPDEAEPDTELIYEDIFYKQHVYRGERYTLVFLDPRTDGMKYFGIFDNEKERTELLEEEE